jgi:hypothetical protein
VLVLVNALNSPRINNSSIEEEEEEEEEEEDWKPATVCLPMNLICSAILICNINTTHIMNLVVDSGRNL